MAPTKNEASDFFRSGLPCQMHRRAR